MALRWKGMVFTRNQSRSLQDPERKVKSLEGFRGNNNAIVDNLNEVVWADGALKGGSKFCSQCLSQDSIGVTFLAETSIHGVKYIVQENRHWSERLFWIVAFVLGISSSVYLIHGVWDRYQRNPVILTFDVNEVNTNSIPFPAVTICNVNWISKRLVDALELTLKKANPSDPKYIEAKHKLGILRFYCEDPQNISGESKGRNEHGRPKDMIGIFINDTDPCDEMITACIFNGNSTPCSSVFKPIMTATGKCCTFNMLPLALLFKEPETDTDLHADHKDDPIHQFIKQQYLNASIAASITHWSDWQPLKQLRAGQLNGLSIFLHSKLDEYYCPSGDFEGFRFSLHSPFEMPLMEKCPYLVELGKQTLFEINPDITKADADIRDYPQEKRKCYFGNEKQLKLYKPYTSGNCIEECAADYLASICGCTPGYLPNYNPDHQGKRICSRNPLSDEYYCLLKEQLKLDSDLDRFCPGCDPLCEEIKYNHGTSMANFLSSNQLLRESLGSPRNKKEPRETVAFVHIYFGSERTVPKLRKALYGWTDLIANTGGILGLCLGFSVISGIELLYFFTLRRFWSKNEQRNVVGKRGSGVSRVNAGLLLSRSNAINPNPTQHIGVESTVKSPWM